MSRLALVAAVLLATGCDALIGAEFGTYHLAADSGASGRAGDDTDASSNGGSSSGGGATGSGGHTSTGGAESATGGAPEDAGAGGASTGGAPAAGGALGSGGASSGGSSSTGGAIGAGGVPQPACCTDADCPATGVPYCSPWGTCYQGGDPYNCDYDSFCESYCVHCSGSTAGACVVTSAPGAAHVVKSCVCS